MNIQLRVRTDEDFPDIHYIKDWLAAVPRGFAFKHNKPGNHHYHVYLFGLERNTDAMRRHIGKYLAKECYSVSTTAGGKKRLPITVEGAYQYGTESTLDDPVWSKGFSLDELKTYHGMAEKYYKPIPIIARPEDGNVKEVVLKVDRVWERLRDHREEYEGKTIKAIKSKLCAEWLNDGKAIPRPSDLHRYALSLFMLNKYKDEVITDTAFMEYLD